MVALNPEPSPGSPARDVVDIGWCLPIDETGRVVGGDDLAAQMEQAFLVAQQRLAAHGLTLDDVVKTVDYTTFATLKQYKGTAAVRRAYLSAPYPAAAGILMPKLTHPGVLVELQVTAATGPRTVVNPGWARYDKLTYSPAVRTGSRLFMSGQAALDPATETAVHEGDPAAQTAYTWQNIVAVLEAAGTGPAALVSHVDYLVPTASPAAADVDAARRSVLGAAVAAKLSSSTVLCAGLLRREFLVEIDPHAVIADPS